MPRRPKKHKRRPKKVKKQVVYTAHPAAGTRSSVMQNDVEKRTMHVQPAVILDKSQFSEPVHEEAHASAGCADHFGESFLPHFSHKLLRFPFLPTPPHYHPNPSNPSS